MSEPLTNETRADVPAEVFGKFLQALAGQGLPTRLVDRLSKTLLKDENFSERALKQAILDEEPAS